MKRFRVRFWPFIGENKPEDIGDLVVSYVMVGGCSGEQITDIVGSIKAQTKVLQEMARLLSDADQIRLAQALSAEVLPLEGE